MSFPVAVQSAIFYILSCTPCAKVRHRHRARQEAKKERAEKARIETEQPGLYRHPSPFSTNPYWDEEIAMGPALPKKGASSKNTSQRALTSASGGQGSSIESSTAIHSENSGSSPTMVPEDARTTMSFSVADSSDWNHKRYEREDEELWGHDISRAGHKLMDAIAKAGSSAGRLLEAKLGKERSITDEDRRSFYFTPKNPPVNDYHPPVVSGKPLHKDGYRWMLQPPPPAKVMEGKVPVARTGSQASMASRRTAGSHADSLEPRRLVSKKLVEDKLRKGELPSEAEMTVTTRPTTGRTATSTTSLMHAQLGGTRSRSLSLESEESSESILERRRKKRASRRQPITPETHSEEEENEDGRWGLESVAQGRAAQRPRLETIASTSDPVAGDASAQGPRAGSQSKSMTSLDGAAVRPSTPVENLVKQRAAGSSLDSGLALSETTA
ncbi:Signal peptide-containing protein [Pleurostoma richardsiae]|uniref:Signal peptide-containing protein n=1 Tax=Pleurostoma richardsiae TaxID=41990 RepID=A0AA38RVG2_9PEZI|nr:Signal peptide-containing protein [Pleurostoma richardsiae]